MRKLLMAGALALTASPGQAAETITVTGEAIDTWCYFSGVMGGPEAEVLNQATYVYLARNVAVGLAFFIAAYLRNAPMLFVLIFVRLVTDLIDLPTFLSFGLVNNTARAVSIFVFAYYIPPIFALWYLWKKMRTKPAEEKLVPG